MNTGILNTYKVIVVSTMGWALILAGLLMLQASDAVIITLYFVGMIAFALSMAANAIHDIIVHRQEQERIRNNPLHMVWAKNAWAKARDRK